MNAAIEEPLAKLNWISTITQSLDITALLHSNDSPSPLQIVNLKTSAKILEGARRGIQAVFDLLENEDTSLEAQMSRVQFLQHDYNTILSPIRRVPAETVMEILRHTWAALDDPDKSHVGGFNVFTKAEGPWLLGKVCRLWRDVVGALCHEIWTTMTVEIPANWPHDWYLKRDVVASLEHALKCTHGYPIDFMFKHGRFRATQESDVMQQCFSIMMAHSVRWRRVKFIVHRSFLPRLDIIHGKLDRLTDVYVQCRPYPEHRSDPLTAFEIAPKLRNLHLKGVHSDVHILFPTANLVSFCDERSFWDDRLIPEYVDIIKSSPNLLSFSYHNYYEQWPYGSQLALPIAISQSIQTLSVSSAMFMRSVKLPALREVALTAGYDKGRNQEVVYLPRDVLVSLSQLIDYSQCSLVQLSVVDTTIVDNDLVTVLRQTLRLEELSIQFNQWDRESELSMESLFVEHMEETTLVGRSVRHSLVPSLKSLGVVLRGVKDAYISFVDCDFVAMITSRHESGALMKLRLNIEGENWTYDFHSADKKDLMALRESGLTIDFKVFDSKMNGRVSLLSTWSSIVFLFLFK